MPPAASLQEEGDDLGYEAREGNFERWRCGRRRALTSVEGP